MNEKIQNIQEEYNKFETIYKNLNNQLKSLVLTDIMASLMTEEEQTIKDENGNDKVIKVKKYDAFEELVAQIKELLESVKGVPDFDLEQSIQSTLDQMKRMRNEALISMRTLHWVKEGVLKEDEDNA